MLPETIAECASKIKNVIGVKQSNPDMDQVTEIKSKVQDDFVIYSGDDSLTLPMLSLGAYGVISVSSHLIGNSMKQMISSYKSGDVNKAMKLQLASYLSSSS